MPPAYSFIIPARNEPHLMATVANIRRLGGPDRIEIIVVDDQSTTPVPSIPDCLVRRTPRHWGASQSRAYGAEQADGEVLVFTDGHVAFSNNYLDEIHREGVSDALGGIVGAVTVPVSAEQFAAYSDGTIPLDPDIKIGHSGWCIKEGPPLGVRTVVTLRPRVVDVPYVGGCAIAISNAMYRFLGGFDTGLVGFGSLEDCELGMRCRALGFPVRTVNRACVWHNQDILRRFGSGFQNSPHQTLDHPRYSGSFLNTIRLIGVHFPPDWLEQFPNTHAKPGTPPEYLRAVLASDEIKARREWLDSFRRVSHSTVLKQMTRTAK